MCSCVLLSALQESPPVMVQSSVALVLRLVQAVAELPDAQAGAETVRSAVSAVTLLADQFWNIVFQR